MPFFHKSLFENFGCKNKYAQNNTDYTYLTCDKENIVSIWETGVGVDVSEKSDFYGCLNKYCCDAMIGFVKGKFNFLATFCIVAVFFLLVSIMTSQYMHKKIKKYHTQILSHKKDNYIFIFMLFFTVILSAWILVKSPKGPSSQPQPLMSQTSVQTDFYSVYDVHIDRVIGVGTLNEEGWWNFDRFSFF